MNLNNPHDKLFKAILQDKTLAIDYFQQFLPTHLVKNLDFESLTLTANSYVDDKLSANYADVVFTCKIKNKGTQVDLAILLEHKSYVDKNAPVQLLYYVATAWMQAIANKEKPRLVIPVLFYHGKEPWEYATIEDYFDDLPPELGIFLPNFEFVYNNIQGLSDQALWAITNQVLAISFLTMKHYHDHRWIENNLAALFAQIVPGMTNFNRQLSVYVFNFVQLNQEQIMNKLSTLSANRRKEVMSTYDLLIEEGMIKGRQEGRHENHQEGRQEGAAKKTFEVVCAAFTSGITPETIATIVDLSTEEVLQILSNHQLTN